MSVLRGLILYFSNKYWEKTGRGIGRTRLMKLLFLVDLLAKRETGKTVTGVEWVRWLYGPFSRKVLDEIDELVEDGLLEYEVFEDLGEFYRYRFEPRVPENVEKLADRVLGEYGLVPLDELLKKVYDLPEIKNARMGDRVL